MGEKKPKKNSVICFPRKEREGSEETWFTVLPRDLPRREKGMEV